MPPPRPKVPPYLLMLVVSFALVGLIGYQTLKDRKISGDLFLENRRLKELIKKEQKKATDLHEKLTKLSSQKEELDGLKDGLSGQLIELKRAKSLTDEGKRKVESSLLEKENEVKDLKEKLMLLDEKEEELKLMKKEIVRKDAEISDLKAQIKGSGKYSSEKHDAELTNTSESAIKDDEKHEKKEMEEHTTSFEKGIAEKDKKASEVDVETENTKGEATTAKKKSPVQNVDLEDEESKVDDREETLMNEDAGEEADADKTHDEDETDEHLDVDMEVVNKADLDENEMAAME